MGKLLDPSKPTNYISNMGANKLYCKDIQAGFRWLTEKQWTSIDLLAQREDQYTGYFVESHLDYRPKLQHSHNDYPLAKERVAVSPRMLTEKKVEHARHYSRGLPQKDASCMEIKGFCTNLSR